MKTLLVNDTRSARHVGCELVIRNSLSECTRVGLQIVGTVSTANCKQSLQPVLESTEFDLLLVNGEGSMHHDRPVPTHICEAAKWANEHGKRVVLYNSLWFKNQALNAYLKHFDLIYCRDNASADAIRAAGHECTTVPDMIFATSTTLPEIIEEEPDHDDHHHHGGDEHGQPVDLSPYEQILVIDSIDRKTSERLSKLANHNGLPFMHMDKIGWERLRKRWFIRTGAYADKPSYLPKFLHAVADANRVISGRFHGTCLAMVFGKPVVSFQSNTPKLEALHRDIGLDPSLVLTKPKRSLAEIERAFEALTPEQARINSYVDDSRKAITGMFDNIARSPSG